MLMLRIVALALALATATAQGLIAGYYALTNVTSYLNRDLVQDQLETIMASESCPSLLNGDNFYNGGPPGNYLKSIPTQPLPQSAEYREYIRWAGNNGPAKNFHKRWVDAAFAGGSVSNGEMVADFSGFPNDLGGPPPSSGECVGLEESVKKATSYVYNFIEIVQLMQASIEEAKGNPIPCVYQQNSCQTAVKFWDASVAIYVGSIEGQFGRSSTNGKSNYALANKRCRNFKNCGPERDEGNSKDRTSPINTQILAYFSAGQHAAFAGDWALMEDYKKLISAKMVVPWIQGTLRYAWRLSSERARDMNKITSSTDPLDANGDEQQDANLPSSPIPPPQLGEQYSVLDKEVGEAAAFALGAVPKLWACSSKAGEIVWPQLGPGQGRAGAVPPTPPTPAVPVNFQLVKLAFECNYKCLLTSCTEVGSLYDGVDKDDLIVSGDSDATIDAKVDIRNGAKTCDDKKFGVDPKGYSKCKKIVNGIRNGKCKFLIGSPGVPKRDKLEYFKKTLP